VRSSCSDVFSAIAISFSRAAVPRDMENVMLVSVFSSLPCGLVRKCLTFRFLMAGALVSVLYDVRHGNIISIGWCLSANMYLSQAIRGCRDPVDRAYEIA
jgi:hypothetical protein